MTLPEAILWQRLRRGQLRSLLFRRQHPVGPYILDFYCSTARLAVEIDGMAHESAAQFRHDLSRDAWLTGQGIRVLRLAAADILRDENLEQVLLHIAQMAAPSTAFGGPPPPQAGEEPARADARDTRRG